MTALPQIDDTKDGRYLVFTVGAEEYGIDVHAVRELRPWSPMTTMPHAPPHFLGLMNLRGVVLTIVDLSRLFDIKPERLGPRPRAVIVVAEFEGRTVGLLVDAVADLVDVSEDELRPTPMIGDSARPRFVCGLAVKGERIIRLTRFDALLTEKATS